MKLSQGFEYAVAIDGPEGNFLFCSQVRKIDDLWFTYAPFKAQGAGMHVGYAGVYGTVVHGAVETLKAAPSRGEKTNQ